MKNSLNFANTCLKVVDTRRRGQEEKEYIPVGESRNLILAISAGFWKTALFEGIDLPQSVIAEVRLLDEAGECFTEVITFQLGFTNANNPVFKRIQAAP